ncbi:MAG TPA: hypothetical protein VGH38_03455 [Bryobacteraceae bacterium]|jgi:photosystem II stability/assembly factor-like uncharacterized protein
MKWLPAFTFGLVLYATPARSQDVPPPPPPAAAAPISPPVLENNGKPIVLPYQCTIEDIQSAGLSCSEEEPCAIYLELTAVETAGNRILAAGNIHSAAVTLFTVLLASDDAGQTWREVADRIRSAGLDRIQFLDLETGWASGETLSPITQDPFLLVTTDGGKTWRQRPIFGDARESRYGSIQQFFFTAKDSGSLIVDRGAGSDGDRYEMFESPNAGESWDPKETSNKPMRLKRAPVPSTEWRVRADAATHSFHVEHKQGTRWTNVTAFSVKLAPCAPGQ